MVKRSAKGRIKDLVSGASSKGIQCVGNVCFNPDTGKLEIELQRDSCPPEVIKRIVEETIKGIDVELVVPRPKK